MAAPVTVTLDRKGTAPLDLTPLLKAGSLRWSSVMPGGFASCTFELEGDFRQQLKQVPYLSIARVVGDSGRVLFEGQIEDLSPTLSEDTVGIKVGAYGLQNTLKEVSAHGFYSKRDLDWGQQTAIMGAALNAGVTAGSGFATTTGNIDPTDLTKAGVQVASVGGVLVSNATAQMGEYTLPSGLVAGTWLGTYLVAGTDAGTSKWTVNFTALESGTWTSKTSSILTGAQTFTLSLSSATALRCGVYQNSGAAATLPAGDTAQFYDMRILGVGHTEDTAGGFYGGTLIRSLVGLTGTLGPGVVESGSDFTVEHLDASTRRTLYDLLSEVAAYYSREWAVWEDALLDWRTPQLSQPQWVIPISQLSRLDLDASVTNSASISVILYTDAASGLESEQSASATDRRNPYVLNGHRKDRLVSPGFAMTSNTAQQLATKLLSDLGFGPVPAAGTIALPGETIVQHAQGNAAKAWELRAGDNVTIPELPLADVFTQDGRGEVLFHVISAEASGSDGTVTLSLDSYGSKRSDVLLARLAAVTHLLGG